MKHLTHVACKCLLMAGFIIFGLQAVGEASTTKALFMYWRGETPCGEGLKAGLTARGIKASITEFNADKDKSRLNEFISTLDEKQYDFIYTFGTTVSLAVAAKVKKTPIVFGIVASPVKSGLIANWTSSGRNITGVSHIIPYQDQYKLLFQLGGVKKVGFLYNDKEKNALIAKAELEKGLASNNAVLHPVAVSSEDAIPAAVNRIIAAKPDMVYLPSDSFIIANADKILPKLNAAKLRTYGAVNKLVVNGAMIGIVAGYDKVGLMLAEKVKQIIAGNSPDQIPSDKLPVDLQTIVVNAKTVEQLGAELPYDILSLAKILE